VGTVVPNPWKMGRKWTWLSFVALAGLWAVATFIYVAGREPKLVFEERGLPLEPYATDVTVGKEGEDTTVEFFFEAAPLSNAWAYADVILVPKDSEEAIGFGTQVEEWHGVSGGEAWREGSTRNTVLLGGIPGGDYMLQINPQAGQQGTLANQAPDGLKLNVKMRQDVVLARYILASFFIILGFPILYFLFGAFFEGRRWSNSDYAGES
jgi:hypothetical protein